jgi:hypothetical protein
MWCLETILRENARVMTEIEHPDHSRPNGKIYRILVLDTPDHVDELTGVW